MIFYFSGTGNSLHVAKVISTVQGEQLMSIAKEIDKADNTFEYKLKENELLGFAYPIYAWGPPKIVLDFISRMKVTGGRPYVFSICTCGGEEGNATKLLDKNLTRKNLKLDSAFTIVMPNNYMIGFDVDAKDVVQKKLRSEEQKLTEINEVLAKRQSGIFDTITGKLPALKTTLINPMFNKFALNTKRFYATDDCTRCGICERVCPVHSITVKSKPVWGKSCTQCFACINRCPVHAIQYGKGTIDKGRYTHPELGKSEN